MQRFPGFLGAAGALVILFAACGGKVVVDAPSTPGTGGAGGAGGEDPFTAADGPPNPTTDAVTTGSGATCDPAYTCLDAISLDSLEPEKLCPGSDSKALYDALIQCACTDNCADVCADNACAGFDGSEICKECVADSTSGCAGLLNACVNDQ